MSSIVQPKDLKVVFDLDDTLVMTMVKFNRAAFECGGLVAEALGWHAPYAPELLDMQVRIDVDLADKLGFGPTKYAACWLQTYQMLCDGCGLTPDENVMYRLQRAATKPFIGPCELVPGAFNIVSELSDSGYELYMCTMGDQQVQLTKLNSARLTKFFPEDRVHVVQKSKVGALRQIAGDSLELTVMIGDSLKSDIKSAQEVGIHPVHVVCPTQWLYNMVDESELDSYWRLSRLDQVPGTLARILKGEEPD